MGRIKFTVSGAMNPLPKGKKGLGVDRQKTIHKSSVIEGILQHV